MKNLFDPKKTALLVIDVQKEMTEESGAFQKTGVWKIIKERRIVENIARAMTLSEKKGILVIRIRHVHRPGLEELPDRGFLAQRIREFGGFFIENTKGIEYASGLGELKKGQIEIIKRRFSAFYGTDLETILRARDIDTLIITGLGCYNCTGCTVASAVDRDYNIIVLRDCVAGLTDEQCEIMLGKVWPFWNIKIVPVDEALSP